MLSERSLQERSLRFSDTLDLPGPLRYVVTEWRSLCVAIGHHDDPPLRAAVMSGVAQMAVRWIALYGLACDPADCQAAQDLVVSELRRRTELLFVKKCGPPRPHPH